MANIPDTPGIWVVGQDLVHRTILAAEDIDISGGLIAGYGALAASDMVMSRMPQWTTEKIYVDIQPTGPDVYTVSFYPRGEPGETVQFKAFSWDAQKVVTMKERPSADIVLESLINNTVQTMTPEIAEMMETLTEDAVMEIFAKHGILVRDASGNAYRNPMTGRLSPRIPAGGLTIAGVYHPPGFAPTSGLGLNV